MEELENRISNLEKIIQEMLNTFDAVKEVVSKNTENLKELTEIIKALLNKQ